MTLWSMGMEDAFPDKVKVSIRSGDDGPQVRILLGIL